MASSVVTVSASHDRRVNLCFVFQSQDEGLLHRLLSQSACNSAANRRQVPSTLFETTVASLSLLRPSTHLLLPLFLGGQVSDRRGFEEAEPDQTCWGNLHARRHESRECDVSTVSLACGGPVTAATCADNMCVCHLQVSEQMKAQTSPSSSIIIVLTDGKLEVYPFELSVQEVPAS